MRQLCLFLLLPVLLAAADAPAVKPLRPHAFVALSNPRTIAVDAAGNLFVGDVDAASVFKITPAGKAATFGAGITDPIGVAVGRDGAVVVADADANIIYRISADGKVTKLSQSVAGSGVAGLATPTSVAVDAAGNVFVANNGNNVILKLAPDGTTSVLAGKAGVSGGMDGTVAAARFATPRGIAIDAMGNLYVADEGNCNIRKITPGGVVSTLAGTAGSAGSADGTGALARFGAPRGLAADAAGTIYVADTDNHVIRRVTRTGVVTTLAGRAGGAGAADGQGSAARFSEPRGIAVDANGFVFVADTGNAAIRQITPDGVVTTIAGPAPAAPAKPAQVAPTIRIKTGVMTAHTDATGVTWLPDQGFEDGDTIDRPDIKIANTKTPSLYQAERYSMTKFACKVPNGKYVVKLHFAETYEGIGGPGERVFSFNVEGHEFKDFDVWVKAGGPLRAYVETVNVDITDGQLDIVFTSKIENPEINAIEIIPAP